MLKKGDTIPGIFSVLVGAYALIYNFAHPKMSILSDVSRGGVGPGFFPFICGVALVLFGVVLIINGIRQNGSVDYFKMTPERKKNFKVVGLVVLAVALFLLGWKVSKLFYLLLPVYCFAINKILKQSTKFSIIFTVIMTAFVYVLFTRVFTIRFMP